MQEKTVDLYKRVNYLITSKFENKLSDSNIESVLFEEMSPESDEHVVKAVIKDVVVHRLLQQERFL